MRADCKRSIPLRQLRACLHGTRTCPGYLCNRDVRHGVRDWLFALRLRVLQHRLGWRRRARSGRFLRWRHLLVLHDVVDRDERARCGRVQRNDSIPGHALWAGHGARSVESVPGAGPDGHGVLASRAHAVVTGRHLQGRERPHFDREARLRLSRALKFRPIKHRSVQNDLPASQLRDVACDEDVLLRVDVKKEPARTPGERALGDRERNGERNRERVLRRDEPSA